MKIYKAAFDSYPPDIKAALVAASVDGGTWYDLPPSVFTRITGKGRVKGLGDVVAMVTQPIAKAIDAVVGTDIQHCGGCAVRRDKLNRVAPFN